MKIFISYRRADSQVVAGRIAQFLDAVAAVDEVFLDVDDIPPGADFERRIQHRLAAASHVFVLIGARWPGPAGADGRPRLFADDAPPRAACACRPAGMGTTRLPPAALASARRVSRCTRSLPPDLSALPKLNAFVLRSAHFDEDMDALLDVLIGGKAGRGSRWRLAPLTPRTIALRALAGVAGAATLLLLAALVNRLGSEDCYDLTCRVRHTFDLPSDADALGMLWMLVAGLLAAGALAPFAPRLVRRLRRRRS